MIRIPLQKGAVALVDDCDAWLASLTWTGFRHHGNVYAIMRCSGMQLHRAVLGLGTWAEHPVQVDHVNGNGLDCRRDNLRPASGTQNQANRRMQKNNTSGFRGVRRHSRLDRWQAQITFHGRQKFLGLYARPESAAVAYDDAARQLFGEFATLNFPRVGERGCSRSAA